MQALARFILRGRAQAFASTLVGTLLTFLFPLVNLGSAVIALVTLREGAREGLVQIAGVGILLALFALSLGGSVHAGLLFAAFMWLPVWLIALQLRRSRSLAGALELAGAFGLLPVLLLYAMSEGNPDQLWVALMTTLQEMPDLMPAMSEMLAALAETPVPGWVGQIGMSTVLGLVVSLLLARALQAAAVNPGGFREEFHALRLSMPLYWITVGLGVMGVLNGGQGLFADMLQVVLTLYFLQGLAVVHGLLGIHGGAAMWLPGLYVLLVLFFNPAMLVLALLGFTDRWMDFRARALRKNGNNKPNKGE
jgi:hypothetical protein